MEIIEEINIIDWSLYLSGLLNNEYISIPFMSQTVLCLLSHEGQAHLSREIIEKRLADSARCVLEVLAQLLEAGTGLMLAALRCSIV